MHFFKKVLNKILSAECIKNNKKIQRICVKILGNTMIYINHDITQQQKRILLSYVSPLHTNFNQDTIYHPLHAQVNQIIKCLIDLNFSIDICDCNDIYSYRKIANHKYDYVFGFGEVYKEVIINKKAKHSILFVTENLPEVVNNKYQERINYFKERHPNLPILNVPRNGYFDMEQFILSDEAIVMNSNYNIHPMRKYIKSIYPINVNCLQNLTYTFNPSHIKEYRKNFLWFGSRGAIHKGLDILIDAFRHLPECTLNIYGVSDEEKKYVKSLLGPNTILHERINVLSEDFINQVVRKNVFILSASCSEGMMSGIATGMIHGLIPIITKETGFNPCQCIFEFNGYKVEDIIEKIKEVNDLSLNEIVLLSKNCHEYAMQSFTVLKLKTRLQEIFSQTFNSFKSVN